MLVKELFDLDCGVVGDFVAVVPHEKGCYFGVPLKKGEFVAVYGEYQLMQFFAAPCGGECCIHCVCYRKVG